MHGNWNGKPFKAEEFNNLRHDVVTYIMDNLQDFQDNGLYTEEQFQEKILEWTKEGACWTDLDGVLVTATSQFLKAKVTIVTQLTYFTISENTNFEDLVCVGLIQGEDVDKNTGHFQCIYNNKCQTCIESQKRMCVECKRQICIICSIPTENDSGNEQNAPRRCNPACGEVLNF